MRIGKLVGGAIVLALTMGAPVVAADDETEARNKAAVRAGFKAWSDGTGSPYDLLIAEAKWTIVGNAPVSRTYQSKQEFIDAVIMPFNARMQRRLIPTVREIFAEGDMVIVFFDAEGVAHDGKPYRNTYTWYMRMRDGKAADVTAFFDTIEFTDLWNRVQPR